MRTRIATFIFILCGIVLLSGQTNQEYKDFLKAGVKLTTKEIVYGQLELSNSEIERFDKIFDHYFEKRAEIAQERIPVLVEYTLNAPMMNEESLKAFNNYLMKTGKKISKLNRKYYNKSRKVIPIQKATQFFLAEKYIRSEFELQLIEGVFSF